MKLTDLDWSILMSSLTQIPYLSLSTLKLFPPTLSQERVTISQECKTAFE